MIPKAIYISILFIIFGMLSVSPVLSEEAEDETSSIDEVFARASAKEGVIFFTRDEVKDRIKEAEESNDREIQYILGLMYQYGENVFPDYKVAEKWLILSASQDHVLAMVALGKLYKKGDEGAGIRRNVGKARKWFHTAAKKKSPHAFYELGVLYENGDGVFQNDKKALNYYELAAKGNVLNAHAKLGLFYQHGRGVKQDIKKAIKHFRILGSRSDDPNVKAQVNLLLGGVYADIASKQEKNETKFNWYLLAANNGELKSQIYVADAYRDGKGVQQNYLESVNWYKDAAIRGDIYSIQNLGYIYTYGLGDVEQSYGAALEWYRTCAEKGSAECAWNVGNFYYYGHGVEIDQEEAKIWFDRAEVLKSRKK